MEVSLGLSRGEGVSERKEMLKSVLLSPPSRQKRESALSAPPFEGLRGGDMRAYINILPIYDPAVDVRAFADVVAVFS